MRKHFLSLLRKCNSPPPPSPACSTSIRWNSVTKGWYVQQFEWVSKASCWVKQARLKRLHALWFYLCDFLGKSKLRRWRTDLSLPGAVTGRGIYCEGKTWGHLGVMEMCCLCPCRWLHDAAFVKTCRMIHQKKLNSTICGKSILYFFKWTIWKYSVANSLSFQVLLKIK